MRNILTRISVLTICVAVILVLSACTGYTMGGVTINDYVRDKTESTPAVSATPQSTAAASPSPEASPDASSSPQAFSVLENLQPVSVTDTPAPTASPTPTPEPTESPGGEVEVSTSTVLVTATPSAHDTHESVEGFYTATLTDTTCILFSYTLDEKDVTVPEVIDGYTVVGIGSGCFNGLKRTETITLPDSVQYIESNAFSDCSALEHIYFGSGLLSIGDRAITGCNSLLSLSFPDGIKEIGNMVVDNCEALGVVYIPASADTFAGVIAYPQACPNMVVSTPIGSKAETVADQSNLPVTN